MHTIEHALAVKKIRQELNEGRTEEQAIEAAAKLVQSQGFSAKYSKEVARQANELL